jgi:ribosomal protein S18 acetylase RimI-like enzyme
MELPGHTIRFFEPADGPALQAVFEASPDYFELIQGAPPGPTEAQTLVADLPPDKIHDDKFVFLVFGKGEVLRAVIDLVRNYPEPGIWFLGLLFVAPAARDKGLGTRLLDEICEHVKARGGSALRLGVVQANIRARALYDRNGFRFLLTRARELRPGFRVMVDLLERAL